MLELSFYFALNFDPSSTRTEIEGGKKKMNLSSLQRYFSSSYVIFIKLKIQNPIPGHIYMYRWYLTVLWLPGALAGLIWLVLTWWHHFQIQLSLPLLPIKV